MRERLTFAVLLLVATAAHAGGRPPERRSACDLLTKGDIAAVQGEEFADAKPSIAGSRSICFYQTPSFVNSVSVDVLQSGAKKYWKETFGEEAREKNEAREEGERESEPKRVRGIGRDAYWTGGKQAGSLYVYGGGAVLRVSVGGASTEAQRIERSKRLAAAALMRLGK